MGKDSLDLVISLANLGIRAKRSGKAILISLYALYSGCGELNNFALLSKMFAKLDESGYKGCGLERVVGYYDEIDDLILRCSPK